MIFNSHICNKFSAKHIYSFNSMGNTNKNLDKSITNRFELVNNNIKFHHYWYQNVKNLPYCSKSDNSVDRRSFFVKK